MSAGVSFLIAAGVGLFICGCLAARRWRNSRPGKVAPDPRGKSVSTEVSAAPARRTTTRRVILRAAASAAVLPMARTLSAARAPAGGAALAPGQGRGHPPAAWDPARGILIRGATVVTMDDLHTVIPDGQVLVRAGRIAALWSGPFPPAGVAIGDPAIIDASPDDLLFPGLINLHDHPSEDFLYLALPPADDAIPAQGKSGTDPYANRYQWNSPATMPPEFARLLTNPVGVLSAASGLGLETEVLKYAQVGALLGGETATQGAPPNPASDNAIIRSIDNNAFNTRIGPPRVDSIATFTGAELTQFTNALRAGSYDAWMIHLAEGVRDADRRPGDTFSSRAEFAALQAKGLLTDTTVIIHGTALEPADFAAMRAAPTVRTDGVTDGRGAKLVWSPQSNLVLYGKTTNVYDALAAGVLVSLGTDWTPSGSRTLLHELKVADAALRDVRILGGSRGLVPGFGGPRGGDALDRALADMVTRNPALALRWYDKVGSIEAGKVADLLLLRRSAPRPARPRGLYRELIDATDRNVELVLVGGQPRAGDLDLMTALRPSAREIVTSTAGRFSKAVDVVTTSVGDETGESLAAITARLQAAVYALGGDHPPAQGGPGPATNTYSYLKANVAGGAAASLPDAVFYELLAANVGVLPGGSLNIERLRLKPLLEDDDTFLARVLSAVIDPATRLIRDPVPPYHLYPADLNWLGPAGNPLRGIPG